MLESRRMCARGRIIIKTPREIVFMKHAGELAAQALELAGSMVVPGTTTEDINKAVGAFIKRKGGRPSFRGLYGFKANICISINQELIHGIPSKRRYLKEGDIVSIDVGACKDGYHGDTAATFACGGLDKVSDRAKKIMDVGQRALSKAIGLCRTGNRVGDLSNAIQTCCEGEGFFLPEEYHGHGVGRDLHEDPAVENVGEAGRGPRLAPGMTIAIEPMLCETTKEVKVLHDGWTIVEANGNLTSHFEHTVLITNDEPVILTCIP